MYFPIGWPKVLKGFGVENQTILQVISNRDKVLFAVLTPDTLVIWFCKPCVPIVYHKRSDESIERLGINVSIEWKPDSSMLCISTAEGHLIFYDVEVIPGQPSAYQQCDPPSASLRRDSAELFVKEVIPPLRLVLSKEILVWDGQITRLSCISGTELMVCTTKAHLLRYRWDGTQNRDYCLDLRRIPFCINQQVSKAIPIVEDNTHVSDIEYSPLVGGFGITLNDGRAAFLTATTLKFDPNQVQGIWAPGIDDATCASVNHKYRLIAFGRKNSQVSVFTIDETTGGLETSHNLVLSSKDFPGDPGSVKCTRWTGDGRAVAVSWSGGGVSVWSTFGGLLMCSLAWDYGLNQDLLNNNPLDVSSMEWCTEGYQLWMVKINKKEGEGATSLVQLDFVKSPLSVNPCMNQQSHLYLQADDRLYVNLGDNLTKSNASDHHNDQLNNNSMTDKDSLYSLKDDHINAYKCNPIDEVPLSPKMQAEGKQWIVLPLPATYSATNWPIRYSAIDTSGFNLAVAGRTGIAHYNMLSRKWKLFGNESQEKDFVVTGGMLWWNDYVIVGSFSILDGYDELRFYPRESKLDNRFAKIFGVPAQVLLIDILEDQLVVFGSDALVQIYDLKFIDNVGGIELQCIQAVDVSALCVHPACVVSVGLSRLGHEAFRPPSHTQTSHYTHPHHHIRQRAREQKQAHSMILNVSGRLMMVQREESDHDDDNTNTSYLCLPATVLASCVELAWASRRLTASQPQLTRALWLWCGAAGCRVWLPLFAATDHQHTFMSKRIMLPFHLNIYPLAILFEDAILLGAENDTLLYSSDSKSAFSLPFCVINRTSQVYLHQILRQLLRRNLGYHAWEIARSCSNLPYFPHSLELLLHEVLEEEATSKEPIPDAQLPSVIEFIQEFPVYLQTVVQCARKTEIALWAYLFSAAGKPKELFQECLQRKMLDTAASYLIILQNLESSAVSRQLATVLLDTALQLGRWDLARDLVRFLRAIDPNDVDSPRNSVIMANKLNNPTAAPVSPNAEDLSVILGSMQASRCRSFSTTANPVGSGNANAGAGGESAVGGSGGGAEGLAGRATPPATAAPNLATATVKRKKSVPTARADKEAIRESSTAEEFFIDVMLQRHARRLLASASLQQLGRFASALDFHLVVWLGGERERAARVDSAVMCLRRLHDDFCWPYPVPQQSVDTITGRKTSLAVPSSPSPGDTDSLFGDSGYVSLPLIHSFPIASSAISDAASVCEAGSAWGGDALAGSVSPTGAGPSSGGPTEERRYAALMERLSHQQAEKGSPRAEVQLRYLLQLMTEAGCLEWSLLISVVLRDAMAVLRTTNAARSSDISIDAVSRLRRALQCLCSWADTECIGYKPFMIAVNNQISFLTTVLVNREKQQMMFKPRLSQASIVTTIPEIAPIKQPIVKSGVNQTAATETVKIQQRKDSPQTTANNVHLNNNNFKIQKAEETGSNCVIQ